ncbi:hypothetical protein WJX84_005624 [Apatococcus fuscideae]|uniref:VOC domain-containing protein n=1 Tax=Apatococcus fuscideae TaxID=2026836 RepID=A0AAW1SLZ8_9CHLO
MSKPLRPKGSVKHAVTYFESLKSKNPPSVASSESREDAFSRVTPSEAASEQLSPSAWAQHDGRSLLHTVCFVPDLAAAIHFCDRLLGLEVLYWGAAVEEHLKPCAVVGKGPDKTSFTMQLLEKPDSSSEADDDFGHFSIAVRSIDTALRRHRRDCGGAADGSAGFGESTHVQLAPYGTVMDEITGVIRVVNRNMDKLGFICGPHGYTWALQELQKGSCQPAIGQVMLLVSNLQRSVDFYVRVLGMTLFTQVASIDGQLRMAQLGFGEQPGSSTFIELREKGGPINRGQGYVRTSISTCNVKRTAEDIKKAGGVILRETSMRTLKGQLAPICETQDPDGWKFAFIDDLDYWRDVNEMNTLGGPSGDAHF